MSDVFWNKEIAVRDRIIGPGRPVFVIAEAGVAHFGSLQKGFDLVDLAAEAGADAVKFQVFKTEELIGPQSREWRERFKSRELPYEDFKKIKARADEKGIIFFATAHDEASLDYLAELDVPLYKIGSGEVMNWPFLEKTAGLGKPVILSTGMYSMADTAKAVEIFRESGNPDLCVLHCVTSYPAPPDQINLRAMDSIRREFGVITGYSDHTKGFHIPLAAVARGASVIEKHISIDFNVPDAQDWKVSCGPHDLDIFISQLREIEASLGSGEKLPAECEALGLSWARKSIAAARPIKAGEVLRREMLAFKRPGSGLPPSDIDLVLGRKALQDIKAEEMISLDMLSD